MVNRSEAMPCIVTSYGFGLSTAFTVSASDDSETESPSLTRRAASLRLAGVMRFSVPISSAAPQRPQLEICFFHCSYWAAVTGCRLGDGAWAPVHAPAMPKSPMATKVIPNSVRIITTSLAAHQQPDAQGAHAEGHDLREQLG